MGPLGWLGTWLLGCAVWHGAVAAWGQAPSAAAGEAPANESIEGRYLRNVRQVTFGFEKAGEGYFSPDGKQIIYQAVTREYPFYQIYKQPLPESVEQARQIRPTLVSTGRGKTTCAYFSPDGKKVLFASSHQDPKLDQTEAAERARLEEERRSGTQRRYVWDFDPHMDLYEADLDGSNLRPLTREYGYDAEGAWSRDGKLIAFCSTRDGDPDIYVMNADGTGVRQVTNAPGYDGGPFISPDGNWIVFRSDRKQEHMLQIYVVSIDGQQEVAVTDNVGVNWAPYWHPSRPYLIWAGADHSQPGQRPNYDLWLQRYAVRDGRFQTVGPPQRITDHPGADVLPVFSPDGSRLMWTSTRTEDRTSQLFIADWVWPEE
jgi:TolB protein